MILVRILMILGRILMICLILVLVRIYEHFFVRLEVKPNKRHSYPRPVLVVHFNYGIYWSTSDHIGAGGQRISFLTHATLPNQRNFLRTRSRRKFLHVIPWGTPYPGAKGVMEPIFIPGRDKDVRISLALSRHISE